MSKLRPTVAESAPISHQVLYRLNVIVDKVGTLAATSRILSCNDCAVYKWLSRRAFPSIRNINRIDSAYYILKDEPSARKRYKYKPRKLTNEQLVEIRTLVDKSTKLTNGNFKVDKPTLIDKPPHEAPANTTGTAQDRPRNDKGLPQA
jgi:hypothetical protein